jgi:hypothetical protein
MALTQAKKDSTLVNGIVIPFLKYMTASLRR